MKRAFRPDFASRSGSIVLATANARSKYGLFFVCVMIVAPSATAARSPPEWSKWVCELMTKRTGLPGTSSFALASTAMLRASLSGVSTTIT